MTPYTSNPAHDFPLSLSYSPNMKVNEFDPITVLSVTMTQETTWEDVDIRSLVNSYLEQDDVISPAWFKSIIVVPASDAPSDDEQVHYLSISAVKYLVRKYETTQVFLDPRIRIKCPTHNQMCKEDETQGITIHHLTGEAGAASADNSSFAGPYLAQTRHDRLNLYPIYRLYPDISRTFVSGIYQTGSSGDRRKYKALGKVDEDSNLRIPVPSRLYDLYNDAPLAGVRVAVKNIYDVAGPRTGAESRVYSTWRGRVNSTASSVKRLEEAGCVLVGKTVTTQFVRGGDSIEESNDNLYPFSPPADGYQSCSSSSSGPACALATYDWLDYAIASDTGASIRGPAAVVGLYGNRPTTGMIALDGVVPESIQSDTAGVSARSASAMSRILRVRELESWLRSIVEVRYDNSSVVRAHTSLPSRLLVPEGIDTLSLDLKNIYQPFLASVRTVLGLKMQEINIGMLAEEAGWNKDAIRDAETEREEFDAGWQWEVLGKSVYSDYSNTHKGRRPSIGSETRLAWEQGSNMTQEDFDRVLTKMQKFGQWYNDEILGWDEKTCSGSL